MVSATDSSGKWFVVLRGAPQETIISHLSLPKFDVSPKQEILKDFTELLLDCTFAALSLVNLGIVVSILPFLPPEPFRSLVIPP